MTFIEWFIAAFERSGMLSIKLESIRYLAPTLLTFLFVWGIFEGALARRKIHKNWRPGKEKLYKQMRREFGYSVSTILVFMLLNIFIFEGANNGIFKYYMNISDHGWGYFFYTIVVLVVLQDGYFYWGHRLMHHPKIFKWVHAAHHRSKKPTPFASYAFAPIEALFHYMIVPVTALLFPIHDLALILFLYTLMIRSAISHCGYELLPRSWARHPVLGQICAVTHHDMHHERMNGNFGLYFNVWDNLMGTMHHDYLERVDIVTQGNRGLSTSSARPTLVIPDKTTPKAPFRLP